MVLSTAWTDSLFVTGTIEATEGHDAAFTNFLRAYLYTLANGNCGVVFNRELGELMVNIDPSLHRKYVTKDRKETWVVH